MVGGIQAESVQKPPNITNKTQVYAKEKQNWYVNMGIQPRQQQIVDHIVHVSTNAAQFGA